MNSDAVDVLKIAVAFLGGSVVTFGIRSVTAYVSRPKLRLVKRGNAGLLVRAPGAWLRQDGPPVPEEFFFLRMLVKNSDWRTARSCIVCLSKVIWIDREGEEHVFADSDLIEIEMQWSWHGHKSVDIPRGAYYYIDLFKFWKSDLGSAFYSDRFPSYLQKWGAGGGKIYFFVKVCCDNAPPVEDHVPFEWGGTWDGKALIIT